jgi:hypothetical protein
MRQIVASVWKKRQVSLPLEVCQHLGVLPGGAVEFHIHPDGSLELKAAKYQTIASVAGAAGKLDRELSWQEMREIAREDYRSAKFPREA